MTNETWLRTSNDYKAIRARERLQVEMCQAWLRFLLTGGPRRVTHLRLEVEEHLGLSEYMERAGEALGVVESVVEGRRFWSLPADS
jgi:hypothetical protein